MRVLFDISHPAHVHFYRHMIMTLERAKHSCLVIARDKDVTLPLLEHFGISCKSIGRSRGQTRLGQAAELLARDTALVRAARRFTPHAILTRNPSGVQAARIARTTGVFDTDDGRAAGLHFRLAAPFAHIITSPDCIGERYGRKHRMYPGYKSLAYLHPNRFTPDPRVLSRLRLRKGDSYRLVRFVDMYAAHDRGESGLSIEERVRVVGILERAGRVFISSEGPLPTELQRLRLSIPPSEVHSALAFADMYVGDSQTMAAEAAILGTPTLHCSSWSGRLTYLNDLEARYGLIRSFSRSQVPEFFDTLRRWSSDSELRYKWAPRRAKMLGEKCDVTSWYISLLEEIGTNATG